MRGVKAFSFIRSLGPTLLMIREMTSQLVFFFMIIIVFMLAFGVSTQGLMYYNQNLDRDLIKNIFLPAYFIIGGEYFTRDTIMGASMAIYIDYYLIVSCIININLEKDCNSTDGTGQDCPEYVGAQVSLTEYVFYLIFLNILLVNLLIAIFR
jgi:hypothetical protein